MKIRILAFTTILFAALFCSACGTKNEKQSAVGQEDVRPDVEKEKTSVKGVVIDATLNDFTLQTENGAMLTVRTKGESKEKMDSAILTESFSPGEGVELFGRMEGDAFVWQRAASAETKCQDRDAMRTASAVLLCVRDKNLHGLSGYAQFPLRIGKGEGKEVTTEEEFLEAFKPEEIFTSNFCESVLSVDLLRVEQTDGVMVISKEGEKPNVVISVSDDGWGIKEINPE